VDGQGWPGLISFALVLLFPLAPFWCVLIIVPLGAYLFWSYRTNAHRHYGDDSEIAVDLLTTVIVIPLVGVVATVGTSWAFYMLSIAAPSDRGWINDGWTVLVCTILVSGAFVFMFARAYAAHRNGSSSLYFEPDVDLASGLVELRRARSKTVKAWLPGSRAYAFSFAENQIRSTTSPLPAMDPAEVIKAAWVQGVSRRRSILVLSSAFIWSVAIPLATRNASVLAATIGYALVTVLLLFSLTYVTAASAALDYLRLGRRALTLASRLGSVGAVVAEEPEVQTGAPDGVRSIQDRIARIGAGSACGPQRLAILGCGLVLVFAGFRTLLPKRIRARRSGLAAPPGRSDA